MIKIIKIETSIAPCINITLPLENHIRLINEYITSRGIRIMSNITPVTTPVINEARVKSYGANIGQCKWFNDKLGYGFVTIQEGDDKGKDIFVHHTGIKPTDSNYKTLKCGEYVHFDIVDGDNGPQGVNITGILGGTLLCDTIPSTRYSPDGPGGQSGPPGSKQSTGGQFKSFIGQKLYDM